MLLASEWVLSVKQLCLFLSFSSTISASFCPYPSLQQTEEHRHGNTGATRERHGSNTGATREQHGSDSGERKSTNIVEKGTSFWIFPTAADKSEEKQLKAGGEATDCSMLATVAGTDVAPPDSIRSWDLLVLKWKRSFCFAKSQWCEATRRKVFDSNRTITWFALGVSITLDTIVLLSIHSSDTRVLKLLDACRGDVRSTCRAQSFTANQV